LLYKPAACAYKPTDSCFFFVFCFLFFSKVQEGRIINIILDLSFRPYVVFNCLLKAKILSTSFRIHLGWFPCSSCTFGWLVLIIGFILRTVH
jgi:hypothetical protein